MAQPARALQPSATVRIQNGIPNPDTVSIEVGQSVEFHNEDNTPYEIPLSYLTGGSTDNYPLAVLLPAGGKFSLIGVSAATCQYNVIGTNRVEGGPPYNIIVNG